MSAHRTPYPVSRKPRIAITGGGTAGHVYPALAVSAELKKRGVELLYIGSKRGSEARLVPDSHIPFRAISTGKLRRYLDFRNFIDPFKAGIGVFQAQAVLRNFGANAVFAKGGYVSVPVLFAARSLGIPIVAHESDTVAGLANRLAARLATKVCTGFPADYYPGIPKTKIVFTGNPVRDRFRQVRGKKFYKLFSLTSSVPVILITGGSQGSHRLNELVSGALPKLLRHSQVIHQTGEQDYQRFTPMQRHRGYFVHRFLDNLPEAMATADVVISRAGANALSEIAYLAKPAVIVPLSTAAGNHQERNAEYYKKSRSVLVLDETKATPEGLWRMIRSLLESEIRGRTLSEDIRKLATPDAANKIAEEVLRAAR